MRRWQVSRTIPLLILFLLLSTGTGLAAEPGLGGAGLATVAQTTSGSEALQALIEALKSENESLKALNAVLKAENATLKAENATLRSDLEKAQKRLKELEALQGGKGPVLSTEALANQLKSKVFRVDVFDRTGQKVSTGSAVAVSATEVVTNYHVVEKAWSAQLVTEAGVDLKVLGMTASSKAHDLAVLRVNGPLEPIPLRTAPPKTGEEVVAIGSPIGLTNTVSTGIVSSVRVIEGVEAVQVTAPISQGSSGGGLFDRQGNLIGVTFGSMVDGQNLNFAIPIRYLQPLVDAPGPLQDLPGVNQVTPQNLVSKLQADYPSFELNGHRFYPTYELIPYTDRKAGRASAFLAVVLDNDAYYEYLGGMLVGDYAKNRRKVEQALGDVAALMSEAHPGLDVSVVLYHVGQYARYPSSFRYDEVQYDAASRSWQVVHGVLYLMKIDGRWATEWK